MADALFGKNWKLDPGRTIFSTAFTPAQETRLYEDLPNGYKLTVNGVHNGTPYQWGYTAFYDGQPHPVYGRADLDSITAYRIDDKITIGFFSQKGVDGGAYARKLSDDGKTLSIQAAGRDASGKPYYDVITYTA